MKYFVGYHIGGEAERYYEDLCADLSRRFGIEDLSRRLPAHCTIKPPFDADDVSGIEAKLASLAGALEPTPVLMEGFGHFGTRTIFMPILYGPDTRTQVADMLEVLDVPLRTDRPAGDFALHVSLARFLTPPLFSSIWNYVEKLEKPQFGLQFDNMTLFEHNGRRWNIAESYMFARGFRR
jgi:2'-5' RNA ligase